MQLLLWNKKLGQGKHKEEGVKPTDRSEDWSVNPYALCGVAGNMCGAPMLTSNNDGSSDGSDGSEAAAACTRPCIHPKNPFQTVWTKETTTRVECNRQQQYREAWDKRKALKSIQLKGKREELCGCVMCGKVPTSMKEFNRCGGCTMVLYCSSQCKCGPML